MKILRGFSEAWCMLLSNQAVLTILLGATLLYSFYYPIAYRPQIVAQLPIAVVDLDQTFSSRKLVRYIGAERNVTITARPADMTQARTSLQRLESDGILLIPYGFERDITRGETADLSIYSNGAYMVRTSAILLGFSSAIEALAMKTAGDRLAMAGLAGETLLHQNQPLTIIDRPLYNTREGYGSYVVPAVAQLIVHQTLLFGSIMLLAQYRRQYGCFSGTPELAGWALLFMLIGCLNGFYFNGLGFWIQDYPRGANIPGLLIAMPVFVSAVTGMGLLFGSFFSDSNKALATFTVTSVPFFFLCGISWPLHMMPPLMELAGKLIPTTSGIQMMVKINQMGAQITDVLPEIANLLLLALVYGGIGLWRLTRNPPQPGYLS